MTLEIPRWALERACAAIGRKTHHYDRMGPDNLLRQSIEAHAMVIAKHEKPPVDPLLVKAREIACERYAQSAKAYSDAEVEGWVYHVTNGGCDKEWWLKAIVDALRWPKEPLK